MSRYPNLRFLGGIAMVKPEYPAQPFVPKDATSNGL
jgi:hypothetical protein